jgi:IS5 family transposase
MDKQLSFSSLDFAGKKKRTKRDVFLAEMAAVVPWSSLEAIIEPHYPKVGPQGGRRPFPIAVMLRIYCLQQWYNLSDPGAEEALYDIQSMRALCHLELGRDAIPDETTILNFRHLLETHALTKVVFEAVADHLETRGALLRGGTIVDATLIAASPSTKNAGGQRDPEMHSSKKGNQWCVSRTQAVNLWCCIEDGSGPPEADLQEEASNHPVLLRSKDVVVSDREKSPDEGGR